MLADNPQKAIWSVVHSEIKIKSFIDLPITLTLKNLVNTTAVHLQLSFLDQVRNHTQTVC